MGLISFENIGITGLSACVPRNKVENLTLTNVFSSDELKKIIDSIGIKERRIADEFTTASDLCYTAANQLLDDLKIDRDSIDVLIFMSQTGDFKIPATAPILQHRLGLRQSTICFDLGLACSGYLFAITTAAAYLNMPTIQRVLVLDGETFSKIVYREDKTNLPLYGDAGTATLLEKREGLAIHSLLNTDGSGWSSIKIKAGGGRNPIDLESLTIGVREDGSYGADCHLYMNGIDVFNFTLKVVPHSIKEILKITNIDLLEINQVIFHQANKFMIDFFAKKLKISDDRIPISLDKFGNTSSATIPLTIVSELNNWVNDTSSKNNKNVLLSGFGAGLSWGTIITNLSNCYISDLIEF
jgi:3-oxoacyl-[acyl-carrier-protein] synthase-3